MYRTQTALVAEQVGPAGRQLLLAIGMHRVLTAPLGAILHDLHPSSVRETLHRLRALGLVEQRKFRVVDPAHWYLTHPGCRVARHLSDDPTWDPRPLTRGLRRASEDAQDLAIAHLRVITFGPHAHDLVITRSRSYLRYARAHAADREYRQALLLHDSAWAADIRTPPPKEPKERHRLRRQFDLDLRSALPVETATLIPDLYLPSVAGGPSYIVEVEMAGALGRHLQLKILHLAHYQGFEPAVRIVVVYSPGTDLERMAKVWLRAIRRGDQPLRVHLTTMDALSEAAPPAGLRLDSDLPGQLVAWTDLDC